MVTGYIKMDSQALHGEALVVSKDLRTAETKLIEIIGILNNRKSYLKFGCSSIFEYAEKHLQLKYQKVYDFIRLYEASKAIPALREEIKKGEVGYSKLRVVLPALEIKNSENKVAEVNLLIEKTKTTSRRELEKITRDIAPLPEASLPSPAPVYLGNNKYKRVLTFTSEQEVKGDKAFNLIASEFGENLSYEKFLEIAFERIIEGKLKAGNKKAQIVVDRGTVATSFAREVEVSTQSLKTGVKNPETETIPQKVKSAVVRRDGNKCRCCGKAGQMAFHHIKPQFEDGGHEASNILIVCKSCHALIHQGYLTIDYDKGGNIKFTYKDSEVQSFTDYLFKQKRDAYIAGKTNNLKVQASDTKEQNLILNL